MPNAGCMVADRVGEAQARFDPVVNEIVREAVRRAGNGERLRVDHLSDALLCIDGGFVVRKLRPWRVDIGAAARALQEAIRADPAQGDRVGVATVASLLTEVASGCASVGTQPLFVAILLEDRNVLARLLRDANVDSCRLIRERFSFLPGAVQWIETGQVPDQVRAAVEPVVGEVLQRLIRSQPLPFPPPCAPIRTQAPPPAPPVDPIRAQAPRPLPPGRRHREPLTQAERTARGWLSQLIPEQAERYKREGFVEVTSRLHPGRVYRIQSRGLTQVFEPNQRAWLCCVRARDPHIPSTDRVIAEYFLIRGDEQRYLRTGNRLGG
jgi:hypothetical protein